MILNDLKMHIIEELNKSNLSIDAIYYVMKEVLQEVESTYNRILSEEAMAKLNKGLPEQANMNEAAAQESSNEIDKNEPASAAEDKNQ